MKLLLLMLLGIMFTAVGFMVAALAIFAVMKVFDLLRDIFDKKGKMR